MKNLFIIHIIIFYTCLYANAQRVNQIYYNNVNYKIMPDSSLSVNRVNFGEAKIVIPSIVKKNGTTYIVRGIENFAFVYCEYTNLIILPDSLNYIDYNAFGKCYNLGSLALPAFVRDIKSGAWADCKKLNKITIDPKNKNFIIENGLLFNKDKTQLICFLPNKTDSNFVIPSTITEIANQQFEGCAAMKSIILPPNIKKIGSNAFKDCISLTDITLPSGITDIYNKTFMGCVSLKHIQLPESLKNIWAEAFLGCRSLTSIEIPSSVEQIYSDVFKGCSSLTSIKLPSKLKYINTGTFQDCKNLISIEIPSSINAIAPYAFENCKKLSLIKIPASTQEIPTSVFNNCPANFEVSKNNPYFKSINGTLFNKDLTELIKFPSSKGGDYTIPSTVRVIKENAFNGCSLNFIKMPPTVKKIEDFAFANCPNLKSIKGIPNSASIGVGAFGNCNNLNQNNSTKTNISNKSEKEQTTIQEQNKNNYIYLNDNSSKEQDLDENEPDTFYQNNINYCRCAHEKKLAVIGLSRNYNEKDIVIPDKVKCKGKDWPVKIITRYAFCNGKNINTITLPNTIDTIYELAFSRCKNLTSINISDSVKYINLFAFDECKSLNKINVSKNNKYYCSLEGVLYNKDRTSLIYYPSDKKTKSYTLPYSVDTINEHYSLTANTNLEHIGIEKNNKTYCSVNGVLFGKERETKLSEQNKKSNNRFTAIGMENEIYETKLSEKGISVYYPDGSKTSNRLCYLICYPRGRKDSIYDIPSGVIIINDYAFSGCSYLKSVKMPSTIRIMGNCAFENCSELNSIKLSDSLLYISNRGFYGCDKLNSIEIPTSVSIIYNSAFYASGLKSITIPKSVIQVDEHSFAFCAKLLCAKIFAKTQKIERGTFRDCKSLRSVKLSAPINEIDEEAFLNCTSLDSVEFSSSLERIGQSSFENCRKLNNIILPDSVLSIAYSAFGNCTNISSVKLPTSLSSVSGFNNCTGLRSIKLPEYLNTIGGSAFKNCSNLTEITLPPAISEISAEAFSGCTNLKSIDLPNAVRKIGENAFANCLQLKHLHIPPLVEWFFKGALNNCSAYITVDLRNQNYSSIDGVLFSNENKVLVQCPISKEFSYNIPNTVYSIKDGAFRNCKNLNNIKLPNTLMEIGNSAFENCRGLEEINLPESITIINEDAFRNCSNLKRLTIPRNVNIIGDGALGGCNGYIDVDNRNSDYIGVNGVVFNYNRKLLIHCSSTIKGYYQIPDGVNTIESFAFKNCKDITELKIPETVVSIGYGFVAGCSSLGSLTIPASVNSIEGIFAGCNAMINIDSDNPSYESFDGVVFSKNKNKLMHCSVPKQGIYNMPNCVQQLSAHAFSNCTNLTSIKLSDSLEFIPDGAFENCKNLISVKMSSNLTEIGQNAFHNCKNLQSIDIPILVNYIRNGAFENCSSLHLINIFAKKPITIEANIFKTVSSECILHIPKGSKSEYKEADVWNNFKNIIDDL